MIVQRERKVCCRFCRKVHTLREYEGMPERWWISHFCEEEANFEDHHSPPSSQTFALDEKGMVNFS